MFCCADLHVLLRCFERFLGLLQDIVALWARVGRQWYFMLHDTAGFDPGAALCYEAYDDLHVFEYLD
jgi:hypothetical protein